MRVRQACSSSGLGGILWLINSPRRVRSAVPPSYQAVCAFTAESFRSPHTPPGFSTPRTKKSPSTPTINVRSSIHTDSFTGEGNTLASRYSSSSPQGSNTIEGNEGGRRTSKRRFEMVYT